MNNLAIKKDCIPAMTDDSIHKVNELQSYIMSLPQMVIPTDHILHGGMYARTIKIPASTEEKLTCIVGALLKVPTILVIHGDCVVLVGEEKLELHGYHVLPASMHRKQAVVALTDTYVTMLFATDAKTIKEAEEEFTDESDLLFSRNEDAINNVTITGE